MDGIYNITMQTPMGVELGRLTLLTKGDNLSGILNILGCEADFSDGKVNGNNFEFSGELHKLLERFDFSATGTVEGNTLKAEAKTKFGLLPINGTKIK